MSLLSVDIMIYKRVIVFFLLLSSGLCAADVQKEPLHIQYGAYLNPPWVIQSEDRVHGITPEYVDEVERRSNALTIDLELKPFRRAIVDLKEGKVDMIAATDHPMLYSFAEPVAPFGQLQMTLFTKQVYKVKNLQELGDFKLGILRGLLVEKLFEGYPNIELVYVNSESSGFDSVDKGYLDGVAFPEVAYRYYSESKGWPYSRLHQSLFIGAVPVFGWTNKGRADDPEFVELRRILKLMHKDGSGAAYMNGVGVDFGFQRED